MPLFNIVIRTIQKIVSFVNDIVSIYRVQLEAMWL